MQGLIGKKIGMTRMFEKETGRALSVTVIKAAENVVHQVKTRDADGYGAVQLGFGTVPQKKVNKPLLGHCRKCGSTPTRVIKEFALDAADETVRQGSKVGVELLEKTTLVDIVGVSKGRGHAGTVKKYHFMRGRQSHGNTNVREHGSTGSNTYPGHVFKGVRMSGHMGNARATVRNVSLVGIDREAGLVFVNGSVPGPAGGIVFVLKRK